MRSGSAARIGDPNAPPPACWMYKKNQAAGMCPSKWSKRWVHVNEQRGRLHIGKKPGKEGTTIFSLSDSFTVKALEPLDKAADGQFFVFEVRQAPIFAVLRCADDAERKRWVGDLKRLGDVWREKRRAEDGAQEAAVTVRTASAAGLTMTHSDPALTATAVTAGTHVTGGMQYGTNVDDSDDESEAVALT